jgi:hypothetical protein
MMNRRVQAGPSWDLGGGPPAFVNSTVGRALVARQGRGPVDPGTAMYHRELAHDGTRARSGDRSHARRRPRPRLLRAPPHHGGEDRQLFVDFPIAAIFRGSEIPIPRDLLALFPRIREARNRFPRVGRASGLGWSERVFRSNIERHERNRRWLCRRSIVPSRPRSPHSQQTNPHRRNRRAIHHEKCSHQT